MSDLKLKQCDICGKEIPTFENYGRMIRPGAKYLKVQVASTVPFPDEKPKTIDICPWCQKSIVDMSLKKRKKDLRREMIRSIL